jgi:hypothetical protein
MDLTLVPLSPTDILQQSQLTAFAVTLITFPLVQTPHNTLTTH